MANFAQKFTYVNAFVLQKYFTKKKFFLQKIKIFFKNLAKINNHLLISLGVGHAKIEHICTLMSRYGIHPKMTGAGGGGSLFAFLKPG